MNLNRAGKYLLTAVLVLSAFLLQAVAQVQISVNPQELHPGEQGAVKAVILIPAGMHQSYLPGDEEYFYLKASCPQLTFGKTIYPETQTKGADGEWLYKDKVVLTLPFTVKPDAKSGKVTLNAETGYNICFDTGSCEPPETVSKSFTLNIKVPATAVQPEINEKADTVLPANKLPEEKPLPQPVPAPVQHNKLWTYLLMAFLGGIILNVMPCVLPVLSIKAMSIVKQAHEDNAVVMRHSFAYTAGILVSFLVLAGVIIGIKLGGESVGWGFQFQNTGFVLVLTALIFAFALSLFDVFIITVPGMNAATKASSRGGYGGSFLSGIFAVLLATPCSAPMLGTALGFAFSQPPMLILAFFFLIGLGLALPFILLGISPKLLKVIPKPGEWMNIFKEVMGFLLLATTVWLLNVIYRQNSGGYLIKVLTFLVFLGFAAWLYGRFVRPEYSKRKQWLFTILALIVIIASAWALLPYQQGKEVADTNTAAEENEFADWLTFSPELVDSLVQAQKPVFLDFGANWCMTCLTNEKTVTTTKEMQRAFKEKNVVLVRGDYTKKNPVMQDFMKKFGRAGVPFYVLYIPGKDPVLFPELITIPMVKNALAQIPAP